MFPSFPDEFSVRHPNYRRFAEREALYFCFLFFSFFLFCVVDRRERGGRKIIQRKGRKQQKTWEIHVESLKEKFPFFLLLPFEKVVHYYNRPLHECVFGCVRENDTFAIIFATRRDFHMWREGKKKKPRPKSHRINGWDQICSLPKGLRE